MCKLDTSKKIRKAFILLGISLLFSVNTWGRNFYFSTSSGDDSRSMTQAQNATTPWKTISKLNSFFSSLLPGDSILFKRGEVFYGSIIVTKSGTTTQPIVIGAYGTGVKPVISGFTTITSWASLGNSIYESAATTCKPTLNMVTINGKNTPMGRYPNSGFLSFETHSGITSITDNQLTGTPNWTGAEVVIRKAKYTLGRNKITGHSGSTITYTGGGETPNDNFGYFIQNDPKTLDLFGEWYLNPASKKLQVFFGASNPSSFNIKASSLDTLLNSNYQSYINVTNLSFEGANSYAIYIRGGQNNTVSNCDIDFSGNNGVWAINNANFRFESNSINHSNHSSLQVSCTNAVIRNNTIKNSAVIPGMAYESNGYNGIELFGGDGTLVEYNDVDSVGGHGIFLRGNNVTIKNNLVNHFAYNLDDVGGIYTVGKFAGRKIIGNIVLNGIGSIAGTLSTIAGIKGIMMEVYSAFIEIRDNTIANAGVSGIHLNSSHDLIIRNNTSFNNRYQILSQGAATDPAEYTRNLSIYRNVFFSLAQTQITLDMWSVRDDVALFGTADSNYYCRPIDDNLTILTSAAGVGASRSLASWQTYSGKDANSKKSPQTITSVNDVLFIYNASQSNKTVPLTAVYLDLDGKTITNSYTLLPYKSAILIKSADQTNGSNLPPVIKNQTFQLNKNTTNGALVGTIQSSDPNSGDILSYSIISGNTNSAFSLNSTSGVLSVANASAIAALTANSYSLVVRVQDNGIGKLTTDATITINLLTSTAACSATGNITYQIWNKIGKPSSVASLTSNVNFPDNPTTSTLITSMEGLTNQADEYGSRIVGYICAPATGNYTFWIASDNNGELWLSTDDQPANKQLIAYHNGATLPRVWNSYATQKSAVIPLIQGQKYYIEALMVEAYGGDCLAVGWLKPGQTGTGPSEVIPGSVLSPLGSISTAPAPAPVTSVTSVSLPSTSSVNTGSTILLLATISPVDATNNTLTWTTSNPAIATVNSDGLVTGISAGTAIITASSTDGSNKSGSCQVTVNPVVCSATGNITYQIWNKIGRPSSVASLTSNVNFPDNPTTSTLITSMEGLTNQADEYGSRIVGYICAPATGNYTFWIASDNNGELWLSTDDQPANKQLIAYHNGATLPRVWNSYATQKSAVIPLIQGQKYYIEALMVEAYGGDCLAVGWLKPGQTGTGPSEVIPGSVLSPLELKSKQVYNTDILSYNPELKLSVYPNPLNTEILNIKLDNLASEATLKIFSISGVEFYNEKITNSEIIHINRSLFKRGVYIVQILDQDNILSTKLVVN